jgi:hypothetical protein
MTIPFYINDNKSDMRGIKSGWYAMDGEGHLVSGPFPSREKCLEKPDESINAVRDVLAAK